MKRVLVSVYDKTGVVDFIKELDGLGWEIISTGGTYKALCDAGIDAIEISEVTKFPEMFDGRVKTLNPLIHGGILYRRDNEEDVKLLNEHGIKSIDMIVNNLYPFEDTVKNKNSTHADIIEKIDIGGPSMLRSAAKNYKFVSVVIDPSDYGAVLSELKSNGDTSEDMRRYLARKVFNYTAYYDSVISDYFNKIEKVDFSDYLTIGLKNREELRYGENPHQKAAFYRTSADEKGCLTTAVQLHGKELSFNNINDSNGALEALKMFEEPCCVAVKHANPCGIGIGETISEAFQKAYDCDPVSIFGGIIALNREVDEATAEKISEFFAEVVLAPSFSESALKKLTEKKNIRLLKIDDILNNSYPSKDMKKVLGGMLVQDRDTILLDGELKTVTRREPTEKELQDMIFAWKCAKAIKSNGVVLAKDGATIGIGLGEVNRVWAVNEAIERAGEKAVGSALASDAFFPFPDSLQALAKAGVTSVIQPGGSIKDEESIVVANDNDMTMVFTGIRHFKH